MEDVWEEMRDNMAMLDQNRNTAKLSRRDSSNHCD
jgi:hypothetical protein